MNTSRNADSIYCVTGNACRARKWEIQERPELRECYRVDACKHTLNNWRHALGDGERGWRGFVSMSPSRAASLNIWVVIAGGGRCFRRRRRRRTPGG